MTSFTLPMKKNKLLSFILVFSVGLLYSCGEKPASKAENEHLGKDNLAYKWGQLALEATANDTERFSPRPTITSRYLALVFVSIFDAWSVYDDKAEPVYMKGVSRRPEKERTLENKEIAISYAAYRSLLEYYPADSLLFTGFMLDLSLDPMDLSMDPKSPEGIGNLAAQDVIRSRTGDGSNQYGEEPGSDQSPYFNYTGYKPANSADENLDPGRWQPKYFSDGNGGRFAPECLTPFWDRVQPIGLKAADQFRPGPPPGLGTKELEKQIQEVVDVQANLTDYQKALVEYMRDGPQSVQQAGHWFRFAQDVSRRDNHTLDQDVKMYFYNQVVAMDAFIAAWDSKMHYDYARPFALVHDLFDGRMIDGWGGEKVGMTRLPGDQWRPYSPEVFLCPPFPSYVSGHSAVSGACAEALRLWTGSDTFGQKVTLVAGAMTEPDFLGDTVVLEFPTFTETAEMAGFSRVLGGYHIQADNLEGLELGRSVAREVWDFYKDHTGD